MIDCFLVGDQAGFKKKLRIVPYDVDLFFVNQN